MIKNKPVQQNEQKDLQAIQKELLKKLERNDYTTLGKVMGLKRETARMRFLRCKEDAIEAMQKVVQARESLIDANQPKS